MRIGFVPKSLNQEYWVNTKKGAEAGADGQAPKLLTQAAGADTQIVEQIDIVENLLAQDVDALVDRPVATPTCSSRCSRRPRRRSRSCSFDSDIADWKPKTAYVGTENKVGGVKAGKYIASC